MATKQAVLEVVVGRAGHKAQVTPGEMIRLFGTTTYHVTDIAHHDRTFKVGDIAVYGGYNLVYTGLIVAITPKTVTIESHGTKHRLSLEKFEWQNYNFDEEETQKQNAATMQHI